MSTTKKNNTKVLVECALLIATVLNVVCSFIPFLNLPFGGGFTVCSMLPIVLAAYRNGTKWGLLTGFVYAVVQMLLGFKTVSAFFMPGSDSYMVLWKAVCVCLIDYIIAYTVLGLGGIFRNKIKNPSVSLCVGSIFALSLRYIAHIISGFIFFGTWADWFFSQDGFTLGAKILGVPLFRYLQRPLHDSRNHYHRYRRADNRPRAADLRQEEHKIKTTFTNLTKIERDREQDSRSYMLRLFSSVKDTLSAPRAGFPPRL